MMSPLLVGGSAGEGIDPVVLRVAAMPLYPVPFDSMRRRRIDQLLPELCILDRLLVRRPPAVSLPVMDPAGNPVADVDAVGVKLHPARPLQGFEPLDRSHQLHAVVRGQRLPTRELPFLVA